MTEPKHNVTASVLDGIRAALCELGERGERADFTATSYRHTETPTRIREHFTLTWHRTTATVTFDYEKEPAS